LAIRFRQEEAKWAGAIRPFLLFQLPFVSVYDSLWFDWERIAYGASGILQQAVDVTLELRKDFW
jgi:hypothetical protein